MTRKSKTEKFRLHRAETGFFDSRILSFFLSKDKPYMNRKKIGDCFCIAQV